MRPSMPRQLVCRHPSRRSKTSNRWSSARRNVGGGQSPPTVNRMPGRHEAPSLQVAADRVQPSPQRVVVEHVRPSVDGGRFPAKRTAGDIVTATADIFADGYDVIVAILRDRHLGVSDAETKGWRETP